MSASVTVAPDAVPHRGRTVPGRRSLLRRYLPPQHGAWAMLLLPWLAGVITAGFRWPQLPLLLAWLSGYLCSYYLFLAVKTRRPGRVRTQLVVYATPTVLFGALVLALRPQVLWYAPAYAGLLAVNIWFAARRAERSLVNDVAAVVQSCLMVFVCATVAAVPPARVAVAFVTVTAYFAGTILHVKTMIRERGNLRYRWASIGYHLAAAVGMLWVGPVAAGVFALLLLRASVLPGHRITPVRIGVVEIVASLLVLLTVIVR